MNFPSKNGRGRAFIGDVTLDITWRPSLAYEKIITLPDGAEIECQDRRGRYDERFDYIYVSSDDGETFYHTLVLLDPSEPDPVGMPSAAELTKTASTDMLPLVNAVVAGTVHSSDLAFCRNLFTIPACMLRYFQKYGTVQAARKAILKDLWSL